MSKRIHVVKTVMTPHGMAAANQIPQPGLGLSRLIAMIFCGEEMGDERPPIQLASAMPIIKHGATVEFGRRVLKIGFFLYRVMNSVFFFF